MVDPELDELRREFLAEAEEKVREMASALDAQPTNDSLQRLGYLAHQLKGSGGSYGYQRISADAAEIEKRVDEIGGQADERTATTLKQYVTKLRTEIENRVKELT
jgi:HPt (histidine-containing phosphotransfer) domain-containing protein